MNSQQIKYAKERLRELYNEKVKSLPTYGYTIKEKDELFEVGEYTVEKVGTTYVIVWTGESEFREENVKKRAAYEAQYKNTLDAIMLGDEPAADLIKAFGDFE